MAEGQRLVDCFVVDSQAGRLPYALIMVSALRETSIAFAVVIGALLLKEPVDLKRWASIAATMTGASMLKLSR